MSLKARAADNTQDIDNLISDDSIFIAKVIDCIEDLEKWRKSVIDIMTPSDSTSTVTLTDERASMLQLHGQMQQLMLNQQEQIQHQQRVIHNQGQGPQNHLSSVKLPKLEIPTFSGDKMR